MAAAWEQAGAGERDRLGAQRRPARGRGRPQLGAPGVGAARRRPPASSPPACTASCATARRRSAPGSRRARCRAASSRTPTCARRGHRRRSRATGARAPATPTRPSRCRPRADDAPRDPGRGAARARRRARVRGRRRSRTAPRWSTTLMEAPPAEPASLATAAPERIAEVERAIGRLRPPMRATPIRRARAVVGPGTGSPDVSALADSVRATIDPLASGRARVIARIPALGRPLRRGRAADHARPRADLRGPAVGRPHRPERHVARCRASRRWPATACAWSPRTRRSSAPARRREPRDRPRAAVARLPGRPARHLLPPLLELHRPARPDRHRRALRLGRPAAVVGHPPEHGRQGRRLDRDRRARRPRPPLPERPLLPAEGRPGRDRGGGASSRGAIDRETVFFGFALRSRRGPGRVAPRHRGAAGRAAARPRPRDARGLRRVPGSWDDLSWGHLVDDRDELDALTHAPAQHPRLGTLDGVTWGRNSAHQARASWQRPFRMLIPASTLI